MIEECRATARAINTDPERIPKLADRIAWIDRTYLQCACAPMVYQYRLDELRRREEASARPCDLSHDHRPHPGSSRDFGRDAPVHDRVIQPHRARDIMNALSTH